MSDEEWTDILRTYYWNRWKADQIENQSIANILVDWVWASGVHGIKKPQSLLGVTADGIVGKATLAAINGYPSQHELFDKIKQARPSRRICHPSVMSIRIFNPAKEKEQRMI